jgi:hypothetical protein
MDCRIDVTSPRRSRSKTRKKMKRGPDLADGCWCRTQPPCPRIPFAFGMPVPVEDEATRACGGTTDALPSHRQHDTRFFRLDQPNPAGTPSAPEPTPHAAEKALTVSTSSVIAAQPNHVATCYTMCQFLHGATAPISGVPASSASRRAAVSILRVSAFTSASAWALFCRCRQL